jgi:hypothetical protein
MFVLGNDWLGFGHACIRSCVKVEEGGRRRRDRDDESCKHQFFDVADAESRCCRHVLLGVANIEF